MQQTEKYKLNLIESSDPFLPEGLNQNTQKIEDAMTAHEAAVDARMDATDQRVAVLEAHKFACGSYVGTYTGPNIAGSVMTQFIPLPFTPTAVFVLHASNNGMDMAVKDGHATGAAVAEGGFTVTHMTNSGRYNFIAFA